MTATIEAPAEWETVRFYVTKDPSRRVTLPEIVERDDEGQPRRNRRKEVQRRVVQFQPVRVKNDEYGNPVAWGYWSPESAEELAEMRRVISLGYCEAEEEDAGLMAARDKVREAEARQAAKRAGAL